MNSSVIAADRTAYAGAYDGKIYKLDVPAVYTDASETSGTISAYWRSGWISLDTTIELKSIPYLETCFTTQSSGTFDFGYGFNFSSDKSISSISMQGGGDKWDSMLWDVGIWGSLSDKTKVVFIKGKGKFFQFLIRNQNNNEAFRFNGIQIPAKAGSPEALKG